MVNLGVVEQFLNHIRRYALCKTTDKILLAVSGGVDSMVMFHLVKTAGFSVAVAHCNFQLRGAEADADEELVRQTCAQWEVPFFTKRFETASWAKERKVSIQMAARDLRYDYFRQLMETEHYDCVATAHHFNDVIESALMNLVRGTGIDGLVGILPKKDRIIRPLLFATRDMILDYAAREKIAWREDASNLSEDYQRNYVRHQVMPRLQELNPGFEETFRDTHERLLGARLFARAYISDIAAAATEVRDRKTCIDFRKIRQSAAPAVLLWEIIKDMGFNYDQCRQMVNDHQPGKVFLTPTHQLIVDRTEYIIERKHDSTFSTTAIERGQRTAGAEPFLLSLREEPAEGFKLVRDNTVAQLDADLMKFPLLWRKWQAGDYFVPLGMRQEKKLSDFLIDLKIPFNSKADITVLESAGEIVWVVGYRINDRYKVTPETRRVLVVEEGRTTV